jgi:pimeloyl-ACP methyl ester carboxylesterase
MRGHGPTVLHFHGGNVAHNGWFFLAHLVEGGYRLLTPDRPGYLGTLLANNGSPEAQPDLAAALLDALAIDTVAVVGNSAGDQVLCNLCYVTRIEQKLSFSFQRFLAAPAYRKIK